MEFNGLAVFLAASIVVIVAPGPDNILVLTRGLTLGRGAALLSAFGGTVGLVCHSVFASLGLSAIVAGSATAFTVIKYVGAVYLVYIGVRAILSRQSLVASEGASRPDVPYRRVFSQAVVSNVFNPKIAVFFLAYLPQFTSPASGPLWPQLLLHGLVFAAMTWAVFSVIGYFSGSFGTLLRSRPRIARRLDWLTGGVLVSLGIGLALSGGRR